VEKHRSNPPYFKEKKLQSKNFNHVNILKVKSIKIILKKTKEKINEKGRKIRKVEKKSNFEK
jgi:hypothetical protein